MQSKKKKSGGETEDVLRQLYNSFIKGNKLERKKTGEVMTQNITWKK